MSVWSISDDADLSSFFLLIEIPKHRYDMHFLDLDDQEELALIDLMTCSCKMAATGTGPPGRVVHKKVCIL